MLTDTKARAAKAREKPYKLGDREGLYLYVTPTGAKSWRFDYRLAGARETLTVGRYPDVGLGAARDALSRARALLARGESPARAKQHQKATARVARANTLQALAEKWYAGRKDARSESWRGNARRWLEQDVYPALGSKPIREVNGDDIERLVRRIAEERGVRSAHYVRLLLAGVFRSVPRHLNVGNPARDVAGILELPKGKARGHPLSAKEIPGFLEAADRYPGRTSTKLAIKLLMLTFVRKRELVEAPWEELDLERGEWVISAARMKMDKPHIVPLSRQALDCFEKLKPLAMGSPYVFPNLGDPRRPMSASTLNKAFDEIGYGGKFTPHGARSTASTALNAQGWSADAIERQLAHTERDLVRAAYNHADYLEERRRMMQSWADLIDGLCAGANVSPIKKAAA
ncbi:MAG TPA: tyrosine-type recombinase/integrase [Burkholderiales bacterium]|nr:tyrosine-type recombinase/integrase [Burkholderiales bacterium]